KLRRRPGPGQKPEDATGDVDEPDEPADHERPPETLGGPKRRGGAPHLGAEEVRREPIGQGIEFRIPNSDFKLSSYPCSSPPSSAPCPPCRRWRAPVPLRLPST